MFDKSTLISEGGIRILITLICSTSVNLLLTEGTLSCTFKGIFLSVVDCVRSKRIARRSTAVLWNFAYRRSESKRNCRGRMRRSIWKQQLMLQLIYNLISIFKVSTSHINVVGLLFAGFGWLVQSCLAVEDIFDYFVSCFDFIRISAWHEIKKFRMDVISDFSIFASLSIDIFIFLSSCFSVFEIA